MFLRSALAAALAALSSVHTQPSCGLPLGLLDRPADDLFTQEQEVYLGDAVAEQISGSYRVLDAPALIGRLDATTARLLAPLPPSKLSFRFSLIELSNINAFALPGGRIYLSRKLVAAVHDDNELAAVIAHEMGHVLAGQAAAEIAAGMRRLLKTNTLGDRQDVFRQYSRLKEEYARTRNASPPSRNQAEQRQVAADRIALYLLASAGYEPEALPRFLDRMAELGGATGNFFTDLFGLTKPEGRRLRDLLKSITGLPADCRAKAPPIDQDDFTRWQQRVAQLEPGPQPEFLPGLISVRALSPTLTAALTQVRFSPNGLHVLAQDGATIHVFQVSPLRHEFDIRAAGAAPAEFSSDSREIAFVTDTLRVERWEVQSHTRTALWEIPSERGCSSYSISSDGTTFACLDPDGTLRLTRSNSNEIVFEQKHAPVDLSWLLLSALLKHAAYYMAFSPDARYFLGAPYSKPGEVCLYDLGSREHIKLPIAARESLSQGFVFLSTQRVLARGRPASAPAAVMEFPSGTTVDHLVLPAGSLARLSNPQFVLLRPAGKYAAAVIDVSKKTVVKLSAVPGIDLWQDKSFLERRSGDLGLYNSRSELIEAAALPQSRLPPQLTGAFSADLKWLTLSTPFRAMVWNLDGRPGAGIRPFEHALYADTDSLLLAAARQPSAGRALMWLDLKQFVIARVQDVSDDDTEIRTDWFGSRRLVWRQSKETGDFVVEVRDVSSPQALWARHFAQLPLVAGALAPELLAWSWPVSSKEGDAILSHDPELKRVRNTVRDPASAHVVQVFDAHIGEVRAQRILEGISPLRIAFTPAGAAVSGAGIVIAGDYLLISSVDNRLIVQRWSDGSIVTRTFGHAVAFNRLRRRLLTRNLETELAVLDPGTGAELQRLRFPDRVVLAAFAANGEELAVVTGDQRVYFLKSP